MTMKHSRTSPPSGSSALPSRRALALAAPCVFALASQALADWTVFTGQSGQAGDVWAIGSGLAGGAPVSGLEAVRLRPIDFVGRTRIERFLPDRPRLESLGGTVSRLVLPAGAGSLYAFESDPGAGPARFGLFRVAADGQPSVLFEAPGTGPGGATSPLLPYVACDRAGTALLLATTAAAGGDLVEVELATNTTLVRTASLPALEIQPQSLALAFDFGAAATSSGLLRFSRLTNEQASLAPFAAGAPAYFGNGVFRSGNDQVLGFLAGDGPAQLRVVTLGRTGPIQTADMPLANIEGPGFLPQALDGPFVALSEDGTSVGYRAALPKPPPDIGLSQEAFRTTVAPVSGPFQATSDNLFLDTIDEIGVLRFLPSGELSFAAGAVGDMGIQSVENLDVYRVDGTGQVQNASSSSGDSFAPFLSPGELSPEDAFYLEPGTGRILLHDSQSGGTGRLVAIDASGTVGSTLQGNVKSLESVAYSGDRFVFSVRRDFAQEIVEVASVTTTSAYQPIAQLPEGTLFDSLVSLGNGNVGARMRFGTGEWLVRLNGVAATAELLTANPLPFSDSFGSSVSGGLMFSTPVFPGLFLNWLGGGSIQFAVGPPSAATSIVLPGL